MAFFRILREETRQLVSHNLLNRGHDPRCTEDDGGARLPRLTLSAASKSAEHCDQIGGCAFFTVA